MRIKKFIIIIIIIIIIISNGVRQGWILSPKLFSVYMDDRSNMLIRSGVGCYIDNVCVNHVFYAENLCLMAPCAIALLELLNICHNYSFLVDLNFNAKSHFVLHLLLDCLSYFYPIYTLTIFLYHMLIQLSIYVLHLLVLTRVIMIY